MVYSAFIWNKLWNVKGSRDNPSGVSPAQAPPMAWLKLSLGIGQVGSSCHPCSAPIWFSWDCERLSETGSISFVVVWHLLSKASQALGHIWIKSQHPCAAQYYLCYPGEETWTQADDADCWRPHHNSPVALLCPLQCCLRGKVVFSPLRVPEGAA